MDNELENNKRIIREWIELAINSRKPEEAVAKYVGSSYRQHNPRAADGAESFINFVKYFAQTFPDFHLDLKRVIAEGDLVATHSHLIRHVGDRGQAVVDISRLKEGKIVEQWDVVQDIPETAANTNTMF